MSHYWSQLTQKLSPYVPGEQPQDQQYIKLNTNENPFPPSPAVIQRIREAVGIALRLYPDPEARKLKQAIADYYAISAEEVFVGNGSDEVLALSFLAFYKGKSVSFPDITYSFYPVYCQLFEIEPLVFALNDRFEIAIDAIPKASQGIIFPNPNAPTGIALSRNRIESLLQANADKVVIVDEAYVDFGAETSVPLVSQYPNLLVVQTFSKSRSLAGMRIGFAIGQPALIDGLERVKNSFNSYPLDMLAIEAGIAAIQDREYFDRCRQAIIATRENTVTRLQALGFEVLPSQANFLFARHPAHDAESLYLALKRQGILVRHFNKPRIGNFLRITIGTTEDMQVFCETLAQLIRRQ